MRRKWRGGGRKGGGGGGEKWKRRKPLHILSSRRRKWMRFKKEEKGCRRAKRRIRFEEEEEEEKKKETSHSFLHMLSRQSLQILLPPQNLPRALKHQVAPAPYVEEEDVRVILDQRVAVADGDEHGAEGGKQSVQLPLGRSVKRASGFVEEHLRWRRFRDEAGSRERSREQVVEESRR
eukprot:239075-Hanusia_phi.AAC.1